MIMKKTEIRKQHIIQLAFSLVILVLIAFISTKIFFRVDLTSERRYTLSTETKTVLEKLDDIVYVKVYLEGDLPVGFKKLHNAIRETLDEFRVYAKDNLQYEFINPSESDDPKVRNKVFAEIYKKGVRPTNIQSRDKEGGASEKIIVPGALVTYKGIEVPVGFLKNNISLTSDENLNNSAQTIEYELIKTISNLTNKKVDKIAFLEGQGELDTMEVQDITIELGNYFQVDRGAINGKPGVLDNYKAIIIARPTKRFTEQDKFVLDQYIMNGGKALWFIDEVNMNTDSLAKGSTFAFINNLNIDDQLFTYGVRINLNIVQDIQCNMIPINAGVVGEQPRWVPTPWLYYPLISPLVDHPISRNLNLVWAKYASQIDTVGGNQKVKKTFLLKTSVYTRLVNAPAYISLEEVRRNPVRSEFNKSNLPIAVLLEGRFPSVYRNRLIKNIIPGADANYKAESVPTKMIIVADGDMIANDVHTTANGPMITALGYDKYTRQTFGNKDFIVNAVNYLTDETGLMSLRAKEFKLRLLNKARIRDERFKWQVINTLLPVLLLICFGFYYNYSRKKKYSR
jgi:gliding-associated putative ABC transporter substrate-binding component GldG